MNKMNKLMMVLMLAALAPGAALATHWDPTGGSADCDGWSADFNLTWAWFPDRDACATILYDVELVGETETIRFSNQELICRANVGDTHSYVRNWAADYGLALDGTYTAKISFVLLPDYGGYADEDVIGPFIFTCGTPDDVCHYTPGYWKNHPENWPVTELTLGGRVYTQAQLLVILGMPVRKDATIILAFHTIAAKLNVANGADPAGISDALADADAVFATHGITYGIAGPAREAALAAKDILAGYNEMGCGNFDDTMDKSLLQSEEATTWGGVKSMYR